MAHSTDHTDRLNRPMMNMFGTPDYAREELNAEIGTIFTKCNLGIEFDETGYIEEQHTAELIKNTSSPDSMNERTQEKTYLSKSYYTRTFIIIKYQEKN